jgi:4-hydroxy-tetrahydrodipicolinate synthase
MLAFPRLLTAMASPMTPDRTLDLDGAQRLAVHLVDHGNDGIVVAGTTGESPTLDRRETLDLFRAVVEAVGERACVLAGCGKNDTAATVELTRAASALGVDGVMVVTPYYNRPSQRGLDGHFRAAAAATDLPVLLYNIPSRTACEIAPETLLRLAEEVENVAGVKDAVGDMVKTSWLAARAPRDFGIWSGDDATALPTMAVGGVGVVSVAGHLVGEDLARMIGEFPIDPTKAREVHFRLLPLFRALFVDTSPGPLKAALRLLGLPAGPVRPPLADADEATTHAVRDGLRAAGVELP